MEREITKEADYRNFDKSDRISVNSSTSNNDNSNNESFCNLDGSNNSNKDNSFYESSTLEAQFDNNSSEFKNQIYSIKTNNQVFNSALNKINSAVFDISQYRNIKSKEKSKSKWYNAFTFTYKQKNEDFKRLFRDLPSDERLLVDYACALQKEILAQGRLYISLNYVCFYAYILGWESRLTIKLRDIKTIQKDKTVKFIPNAITLVLDNDKHFFTSFASRDRTYATLYKMWQIAVLDQSIDNDEINTLVKSFYGDDLGYSSNDEEYEYYTKGKLTKTSANNSADQRNLLAFDSQLFYMNTNPTSAAKMDGDNLSCIDMDTSSSLPNFHIGGIASNTDCSTESNSNKNSPVRQNELNFCESNIEIKKVLSESVLETARLDCKSNDDVKLNYKSSPEKENTNTEAESFPLANSFNDINRNVQSAFENPAHLDSDSCSESTNSEFLSVDCDCKDHTGKEMLNKTYSIGVNYLFECMFGPTEFCLKFWESRKFFDMKIGEWKYVNEDNIRGRRLEYFVALNTPVAVKQCKNVEDQKLIKYIPNKCIVVESVSVSHGIPYADTFAVVARYCITKIDKNRSNFRVHAYIKYSQKPMFMVKAFIEKNAMSALADAYQYLEKRFSEVTASNRNSISEISAIEGSEFTRTLTNDSSNININTKKGKRSNNTLTRKRNVVQQIETPLNMYANPVQSTSTTASTHLVPIQTFSFLKWTINVDTLVRLFIIAMVCLMIINGMLYLKLRRIELLADGLKSDPQINTKYQKILNQVSNDNTASMLELVSKENNDWKEVLIATMKTIEKMGYSLNEWNQNFEKNTFHIEKQNEL